MDSIILLILLALAGLGFAALAAVKYNNRKLFWPLFAIAAVLFGMAFYVMFQNQEALQQIPSVNQIIED